jgi:hypothetical protein
MGWAYSLELGCIEQAVGMDLVGISMGKKVGLG